MKYKIKAKEQIKTKQVKKTVKEEKQIKTLPWDLQCTAHSIGICKIFETVFFARRETDVYFGWTIQKVFSQSLEMVKKNLQNNQKI